MRIDHVAALLHPTSIAIIGARENPTGWTARIFANLERFGFAGPVWPVNPARDEIWGVPCYPGLDALPEAPDHLIVMRAAAAVPDILREAAAAGTRSATLYAAGFSETGTEEGRRLEDEVRRAADDGGIAISGPNCLGNLSAPARLLTLPDDRVRALAPGPVAMVGQSGTTTPAIGRLVIDRGIDCSYIVTSGNETGLTTADYVAYFAGEDAVRVIFCLIEAVRDAPAFLAACRMARDAGKPVIAIKMGGSEQGRAAALAHTGSLAGTLEAFDAVAGAAGVIRVDGPDQAADLIDFFAHAPRPRLQGVAALTYSGGVRGLAAEAAARHGIDLPALSEATAERMRAVLGEGFPLSNPVDAMGFFTQGQDVFIAMVEALLDDPAVGTLLIQEDLPPGEGHTDANRRRARRVIDAMRAIEGRFLGRPDSKPVALSGAVSYDLTDFSRALRPRFPHIALLNEPDRAMRALRRVLDYEAMRAAAAGAEPAPQAEPGPVARRFAAMATGRSGAEPVALDEVESKALLAEYGIAAPAEAVAASPEEAVAAAERIGYPVVLKAVAARLTHKTEAGAVRLGLADPDAVRRAWEEIAAGVSAFDPGIEVGSMLVARAVTGGLELALGVNRDPEMGPVVMFGSGGVLLELFGDVAFGPPGLDAAEAGRMIDATRAGALIAGWRGQPARDRKAVVNALVAAGRIAHDLGDAIEALDINPLSVLENGRGAFALDALVVLRGAG